MTMPERGTVQLTGVGKDFEVGDQRLRVLDAVDLHVGGGEAVVITGPSGTGKSTLLHLLGALERPTRGRIEVNGRDLDPLGDAELAEFRNREVGFVFQDHHLLPQFTVLQNVLLPSLAAKNMAGTDGSESAQERGRRLLQAVGLEERLTHRPAQLSGGERQRAAIARSMINRPSVLLCDEPTGNLDSATAERVADLLFELHAANRGEGTSDSGGTTLIAVTHSPQLAERFARRLTVNASGELSEAAQ